MDPLPDSNPSSEGFLAHLHATSVSNFVKSHYRVARKEILDAIDNTSVTHGTVCSNYQHSITSSKSMASKHPTAFAFLPNHQVGYKRGVEETKDDIVEILSHTGSNYSPKQGTTSKPDTVTVPDLTEEQKAAMLFAKKYNVTPTTRDEKRQVLPARVEWDGSIEEFETFDNKIQGHFGQAGAGYLFNTKFQTAYCKDGSDCFIHFLDEVASASQILKDTRALFGALKAAIKGHAAKKFLHQYEDKQDGLKAWMAITQRYALDGNVLVRLTKLEKTIETKFHRNYKGGLTKWILDYENAFSELELLKELAWQDDNTKKRRLLNNINIPNTTTIMVENMVKGMDFSDTCQFFRGHSIQDDFKTSENATRRAQLLELQNQYPDTKVKPPPAKSRVNEVSASSCDISQVIDVFVCRLLNIEPDVWAQMPGKLQEIGL